MAKIVCPNVSSKKFKALESELGRDKAYLAYFRHDGDIPDVKKAQELLGTAETPSAAGPGTGTDNTKPPRDNAEWRSSELPAKKTGSAKLAGESAPSEVTSVLARRFQQDIRPDEITVAKPNREQQQQIDLMKKVFGVDTKIITLDPGIRHISNEFDGFHFKGTNYVNSDLANTFHFTISHETFHAAMKKNVALKKKYLDFMQKNLSEKGETKAGIESKWYGETPGEGQKGIEELAANHFAENARSPEFWKDVYNYSPSLARQLLEKLKDAINKILAIGTSKGLKTEAWFSDVKAQRDELVKLISGVVDESGGKKNLKDLFQKSAFLDKEAEPLHY